MSRKAPRSAPGALLEKELETAGPPCYIETRTEKEENTMALITCPECGKQISDQAKACPNCGYPLPKEIPVLKVPLPKAYPQTKAEAEKETKAKANPEEKKAGKAFGRILLVFFCAAVLCLVLWIMLPDDASIKRTLPIIGWSCALAVFASIAVLLMLFRDENADDMERQKTEQRRKEIDGYVSGPLIDYTKIVYTQIVSQEDKRSLGSAVVRGAVGGVVAGPVGAAAGAVTAKGRGTTTFLVVTRPQKKNIVTVKNNGTAFNMFCRHLR